MANDRNFGDSELMGDEGGDFGDYSEYYPPDESWQVTGDGWDFGPGGDNSEFVAGTGWDFGPGSINDQDSWVTSDWSPGQVQDYLDRQNTYGGYGDVPRAPAPFSRPTQTDRSRTSSSRSGGGSSGSTSGKPGQPSQPQRNPYGNLNPLARPRQSTAGYLPVGDRRFFPGDLDAIGSIYRTSNRGVYDPSYAVGRTALPSPYYASPAPAPTTGGVSPTVLMVAGVGVLALILLVKR